MLACDADHVTPAAAAPTQISLDAAGNTLAEAHKQTSLIPTSWEPNWDTSVYKRKKNCKKRRDPMEPQKPVSAYALFFRDTQAAIKCRNPKASFGDISKTVASMWDTLDGETKNQYKKRTDMAKKEYLKRLAAYRARLISTVTAGFCGQPPFSVAQSESSNPTLCSGSATQASQSDYRTPSSVASYSGFDGYSQRYGNNNYYSVSSAEHQEAKYQSPVKMDTTRPPGQSYEGGLVTTVPCNQTAYGAYAKMASTDTSNPNAFVTQRVDYLTRAGHGPSDAIPTYASETLYAQTPTPSRVYETPRQAVSVQLPCNYYGASYYRPAQTALYCANEAAKPVYPGAYGGYWTAQVASPLLAPAPQTDTSRYSVSSSSSCSSGEESLTATRNDVQAPPDAVAHPTPTPTSTTTSTSTCDRNGTFDYWANAIGYY